VPVIVNAIAFKTESMVVRSLIYVTRRTERPVARRLDFLSTLQWTHGGTVRCDEELRSWLSLRRHASYC
jgi:hypothetical protein